MTKRSIAKVTVPIICGVLLPGCQWLQNGFKVGPNYSPAPALVASDWIDYRTPASTQPAATQPASTQPTAANLATWWTVFNDPVLNSLMHDAYGQSLTLRSAGERIVSARANRDISIGNLFPQTQNVGGSYTWNKQSDRNVNHSNDQWYQNAAAGFNVGWELDFWGRFRRAHRSLRCQLGSLDRRL